MKKADTWVESKVRWFKNNRVTGALVLIGITIIGLGAVAGAFYAMYQLYGVWVDEPVQVDTNSSQVARSGEDENYVPVWFDKSDPNIQFWRKFDLPKNVGAPIYIGVCPDDPCVSFTIIGMSMPPERPSAIISVGITSGRLYIPSMGGTEFHVELRRGCGGFFKSHTHDFAFEIVDDRVTTLTALIAFFPGTMEESSFMVESIGCRN